MFKLKVYIDTSVISAYFDAGNPERMELTRLFWQQIGRYETRISEAVVRELEQSPDEELRSQMQSLVEELDILPVTDAAIALQNEYLAHDAVPDSAPLDALHIAIAVAHGVDFLLSWNFRHIVRDKTRKIVAMVNHMHGYGPIEIAAPPEIL